MTKSKRPQPLLIRITHWINVPVILVMAMSGLQILNSFPFFGARGSEDFSWVPLQGMEDWPSWMTVGRWLAGARHIHFALAWLLVINAIIYLVYLFASKEFKRRLFWPPRDVVPAWRQQLHYFDAARLRVQGVVARIAKRPAWQGKPRFAAPPTNLYNGLQRAAYTGALALGILEVLSGLAIYKPVQLHWLAWLMGGYDGARVIHFLGLLALAAFVIVHLVMVAVHWRQFPEMITGGKPAASAPTAPAPAQTDKAADHA
jgi:thiosulfate reductase cytochrome b subunit